jgi:tRNA-Thr(GGU) m(6)t(6)A37 methyltransferase TsaA
MKPRITMVTLGVDDLDRAVRFYRDGLGLPTRGIVGDELEHGAVAFFDLEGGSKLAVWPRRSLAHDAGIPQTPRSPSELSIAHNVGSRHEVDEVMAQAGRAGARIVKPAGETLWGGYAGYFQDPDDHLWEVAWNPQFGVMPTTLQSIGTVRSPYIDTAGVPKGLGAQHAAEGVLEIRPELEEGLEDIEGFSHLYVIWIFDRAGAADLTAYPPSDDRPHGVFATRSPQRPNPIGLTVVELLGRDGPRLRVRGVDMLDGTPIVDIKPYLSSVPAERLRRGWLDDAEGRRRV